MDGPFGIEQVVAETRWYNRTLRARYFSKTPHVLGEMGARSEWAGAAGLVVSRYNRGDGRRSRGVGTSKRLTRSLGIKIRKPKG